jgi:hypothetical protein
MWLWLNANANAVLAISAAITAGVTLVLVLITARYVGLTKKLADTALGQLEAQGGGSQSQAA